jgi:hypothetical protein
MCYANEVGSKLVPLTDESFLDPRGELLIGDVEPSDRLEV